MKQIKKEVFLKNIQLIFSLLLILGGCSGDVNPRKGWTKLDGKVFSIFLPESWRVEKNTSIEGDLFAEIFEEESRIAYLEYSPYSPSIEPESAFRSHSDQSDIPVNSIFDVEIDGKMGRLSIPVYATKGVIGIEFWNCGVTKVGFRNRLYLGGNDLSKKNQGLLLEAIFTIKFY